MPNFLTVPKVGVDISDKSIRFAQLKPSESGYRLGHFGARLIDQGIVERGKIVNPEALTGLLRELKKTCGFSEVRVSLPEEQGYLFQVRVPRMKKSELRGSVELHLEESVPVKAEDAVFDYEILSETSDGYVLQVALVPKEVVDAYAQVFLSAGLTPVLFESEAQSVCRTVVRRGDTGSYMVIDFGSTRTGISIAVGGLVVFTSTIEIGGAYLTELIAKSYNVPLEKAEIMKREQGLSQTRDNAELFSKLIGTVAVLKDEINRHYLYWENHPIEGLAHQHIEKLILCGGESNLIGLLDYLRTAMRMRVEFGNVWKNVASFEEFVPPIEFRNSLAYATSLGLSLADL